MPGVGVGMGMGEIALSGRVVFSKVFNFSLRSLDSFYLQNGQLILLSAAGASVGASATISGIGPSVTGDDFLIALRIAFSDIEVAFSLDPWDHRTPTAGDFQKVFYPDMLRGTAFGETLFQTDYDMKKLGFGIQSSGNPRSRVFRTSLI
jgi:hypothetical protein